MPAIARLGDLIVGGVHCHGGHPHPPLPTPGRICRASMKVFAGGKPVARVGDEGHSPLCCVGVGTILIQHSQAKVFIEGRPAAAVGTTTLHCGMASGRVQTGCSKVQIP